LGSEIKTKHKSVQLHLLLTQGCLSLTNNFGTYRNTFPDNVG
jgi:hypothetical protein